MIPTVVVVRSPSGMVEEIHVERGEETFDLTHLLPISKIEHNPIEPGEPPMLTFTVRAFLVEQAAE